MRTVSTGNTTRREIIEDFEKYCEYICPEVLKPQIGWYHRFIMRQINAAINGTGPSRVSILMPPRHWKTLIGRDWFMSYMFGRFPEKIGVYATYNEDFANDAKDKVAAILASEKYMWLFPNARTRNTSEDFEEMDKATKRTKKDTAKKISNVNSSRGEMNFVGRGNALTGIGSHFSVLDDPYKDEEEAISEKINASIWGWFSKVFSTRAEPGNITLIFYTRWISNDIIGRLEQEALENTDPNYIPFKFIRFAAEKDNFEHPLYDTSFDTRALGEPLDPRRISIYAQAKKDHYKWMAMFQQTPLDNIGFLIDISWFARYSIPMRVNTILIAVDANGKENSTTVDRTGIGVWGKIGNKIYLIEIINKKMNYPELKATVRALSEKYSNYWAIIIEDASNGAPLIQDMQRSGFRRVIGVEPQGKSKRQKVSLVIPIIQSGVVHIPTHHICPNVNEFLLECSRFTGILKDEKDDLVDQMMLALSFYDRFSYLENVKLVSTVPNNHRMLYDYSRMIGRR